MLRRSCFLVVIALMFCLPAECDLFDDKPKGFVHHMPISSITIRQNGERVRFMKGNSVRPIIYDIRYKGGLNVVIRTNSQITVSRARLHYDATLFGNPDHSDLRGFELELTGNDPPFEDVPPSPIRVVHKFDLRR
jgi:hypothetical protein